MKLESRDVLDYMQMGAHRNLYFIGQGERRVTMHNQQIRSLNAVWALKQEGLLSPGACVAVVGAGLAGVTTAAALLSTGVFPVLFERAATVLSVQSGCHTRYVHPNIFDWPNAAAFAPHTTLPFLNWRADTADAVVRTVLNEWQQLVGACELHTLSHVRSVHASADGVRLRWEVQGRTEERSFPLCLLTVGFGVEKELRNIRPVSYWRDDALHQLDLREFGRRSVAVVGAGDGGVTDVLRLAIRNFDQGNFLREFGGLPDALELGRRMQQIEDQSAAVALSGRTAYLQDRYAALELPETLRSLVRSARRADTAVSLYEKSGTAFQFSASILNRLMLLVLLREREVKFVPCELRVADEARYDMIVPRIGPSDNLKPITEVAMPPRDPGGRIGTAISTEFQWPPAFFGRSAQPRPVLSVLLIKNEGDRHNRNLVDRILAGIQDHNGTRKGAYIAVTERRVHADQLERSVCLDELKTELTLESFDVILIVNSDVALHASSLPLAGRSVVLCFEYQTLQRVLPALQKKFPDARIFSVPQVVDLDQMANAIATSFARKRLCYLRSEEFPVDKLYFELLRDKLLSETLSGASVQFEEHVMSNGFTPADLPADVDVFCGRYFLHERAPSYFFRSHPVISGYMADFERGAIAAMDINDSESGRRVVEAILVPLAHRIEPAAEAFPIQDVCIRFNLSQAQRFGLKLPDSALRLANELVE